MFGPVLRGAQGPASTAIKMPRPEKREAQWKHNKQEWVTVDDVGNETRGGGLPLSTAATIGGGGGVPASTGAISFALSRMTEQRGAYFTIARIVLSAPTPPLRRPIELFHLQCLIPRCLAPSDFLIPSPVNRFAARFHRANRNTRSDSLMGRLLWRFGAADATS